MGFICPQRVAISKNNTKIRKERLRVISNFILTLLLDRNAEVCLTCSLRVGLHLSTLQMSITISIIQDEFQLHFFLLAIPIVLVGVNQIRTAKNALSLPLFVSVSVS